MGSIIGTGFNSNDIAKEDGAIISRSVNRLTFLEILLAIVIGWLLVALWQRVIENLAFNTFGLNKNSTFQTFILAFTVTAIFLAYAFTTNNMVGGVIESKFESGFEPPSFPSSPVTPSDLNKGKKPTDINIKNNLQRKNEFSHSIRPSGHSKRRQGENDKEPELHPPS